MKKKIQIISISVVVLIIGLLIYSYIYIPLHLIKAAKDTANQMTTENMLLEGDIVFQTTRSEQTKAIQEATDSEFDHCGMILKVDKKYVVFEAVQTIRMTPLENWIMRGVNNRFVVKRLNGRDTVLTTDVLELMNTISKQYLGKHYDYLFQWSDQEIYCSELVWKMYKLSTGLEIGKLQKFMDYNLENKEVKKIIQERYGNQFNDNETVIAPVGLLNSDLLETVGEY